MVTDLKAKIDWTAARAEYVQNQMHTFATIAEKYGTKPRTVEWHAQREEWTAERKSYSEKVREKLVERSSDQAAATLAELNVIHLRDSSMLRGMLSDLMLTAEGKRRDDVGLADLGRATDILCKLFEADRVALGADQLPVTHSREPEAEMSDVELYAKLQEMLKRHPVSTVQ